MAMIFTKAGLDYIADVAMSGGTPITSWFFALIKSSGFTAIDEDDTSASHAGWTESTAYSEATRPQWVESGVSNQAISNPAAAEFTMTAAEAIIGVALISESTKGGSTGTLLALGTFGGGVRTPSVGEVVKIYADGTIATG